MRYVRWKDYGFTHITKDGTKTLCGRSWWNEIFKFHGDWAIRHNLKYKLLEPSDTDDGKRPICGNCKKIVVISTY